MLRESQKPLHKQTEVVKDQLKQQFLELFQKSLAEVTQKNRNIKDKL